MICYLIEESLKPCPPEALYTGQEQDGSKRPQYAAVLSSAEWQEYKDCFNMVIDMELDTKEKHETKAVVNADCLTGTFFIPDRNDISEKHHFFAFALDEKGVVLIDDEGYAANLAEKLRKTKKWRVPGLERFLYDFLELIIERDLFMLEAMEQRLDTVEQTILRESLDDFPAELNTVRGELLDLRIHYEQMIDLGQELQENENGFFQQEYLRYFRLFTDRVVRLQESVSSLRDYVVQLRDLVQSRTEIRQNHIMTLLTVVTSIFMPLTLITGWFGMNFRYMPELDNPLAYPAIIILSIIIVVGCLLWFKKKGWL
ncbi:MAG: magnesium transporter CorA [Stomatobaculum sp.]|nr:magnesium transporter CorA [Stomatobaculum sp.]